VSSFVYGKRSTTLNVLLTS
jgi:hypothetical protein